MSGQDRSSKRAKFTHPKTRTVPKRVEQLSSGKTQPDQREYRTAEGKIHPQNHPKKRVAFDLEDKDPTVRGKGKEKAIDREGSEGTVSTDRDDPECEELKSARKSGARRQTDLDKAMGIDDLIERFDRSLSGFGSHVQHQLPRSIGAEIDDDDLRDDLEDEASKSVRGEDEPEGSGDLMDLTESWAERRGLPGSHKSTTRESLGEHSGRPEKTMGVGARSLQPDNQRGAGRIEGPERGNNGKGKEVASHEDDDEAVDGKKKTNRSPGRRKAKWKKVTIDHDVRDRRDNPRYNKK